MNEENKVTFGKSAINEVAEEEKNESNKNEALEEIKELGKSAISNPRGNIHCLTIIGQIEGHIILPPQNKTTKYEHVISLVLGFIKNIFTNVHLQLNELPLLLANFLLLYLYVLVVLTLFIVLFQMAFIISRLVNRFGKILTVVSVFSLSWVFIKASTYLSKLIDLIGLPDISILIAEKGVMPPVNASPIIAGVIIIVAFFYLTAKLFDNVIEV